MSSFAEYAFKETGGLTAWSVNPAERLVFNSRVIAAFRYDGRDHLTFLNWSRFAPELVPLLAEGAAETLRQERARIERMRGLGFGWADKAGRFQK